MLLILWLLDTGQTDEYWSRNEDQRQLDKRFVLQSINYPTKMDWKLTFSVNVWRNNFLHKLTSRSFVLILLGNLMVCTRWWHDGNILIGEQKWQVSCLPVNLSGFNNRSIYWPSSWSEHSNKESMVSSCSDEIVSFTSDKSLSLHSLSSTATS